MWIACADQMRGEIGEADRFEAVAKFLFSLVDEAFAEGDAEEAVGDVFLKAGPFHLECVIGVHVLEDEQASGGKALEDAAIHLVAGFEWNAIGRVDDGDRLECAPHGIVERRDRLDARLAERKQRLAEIGLDGEDLFRSDFERKTREEGMAGTDVEQSCSCGYERNEAKERAGEEADQDVKPRSERQVPVGAMKKEQGSEVGGLCHVSRRIIDGEGLVAIT